MFEDFFEQQYNEQKQVDNMGMNYLFNDDILVCNYVSNQLQNMNCSNINCGKSVSLDELIDKTLDEIKIFGDGIYFKTKELIKEVPIEIVDTGDIAQFSTGVSSLE